MIQLQAWNMPGFYVFSGSKLRSSDTSVSFTESSPCHCRCRCCCCCCCRCCLIKTPSVSDNCSVAGKGKVRGYWDQRRPAWDGDLSKGQRAKSKGQRAAGGSCGKMRGRAFQIGNSPCKGDVHLGAGEWQSHGGLWE